MLDPQGRRGREGGDSFVLFAIRLSHGRSGRVTFWTLLLLLKVTLSSAVGRNEFSFPESDHVPQLNYNDPFGGRENILNGFYPPSLSAVAARGGSILALRELLIF